MNRAEKSCGVDSTYGLWTRFLNTIQLFVQKKVPECVSVAGRRNANTTYISEFYAHMQIRVSALDVTMSGLPSVHTQNI